MAINLFISLAEEDLDMIRRLRGQFKIHFPKSEIRDYSLKTAIESENEAYIKRKIKPRIKACTGTLVYLSANTRKSAYWVPWEVETTLELKKPVVAMYQGEEPPLLPSVVKKHEIEVIPWNIEELRKVLASW